MSLLRLPKLRGMASRIASVRQRFARRGRRNAISSTFRRLLVDPLEERALLSLFAGQVGDTLVNQQVSDAQFTIAAQSIGVDNDGDFVVAWTRYDDVFQLDPVTGEPVLDPDTGEPIPVIDPETGLPVTDANIYARYFTDEVQRITLPVAAAANNVPGSFGTFSLVYGANEVQKITITATYEPFVFGQTNVSGSFTLGFDLDLDGTIIGSETTTIIFDETDPLDDIAATIQTGLQGLGGELNDVAVQAINPHEFLVQFGDASMGLDQPELTVESFNFTTGFLPAVEVSTVREPILIGPIPVSPDNAKLTATAIEQAFLPTAADFPIGPIEFWPAAAVPPAGPYFFPESLRTALPRVSVAPRSLTEFDITFTGDSTTAFGPDSGKQDHPELIVSAVEDDLGNVLHDINAIPPLISPEVNVVTIKEPSPEFRANAEEPDDPFTLRPDVYDQTSPAVAVDADGDFVIAWQSEVPDSQIFGSVFDIFARRFSPVAVRDPAEVDLVQGVRPLGSEFRVNTFTTNAQFAPAIGMDSDGNFVISWTNNGQDISFFNGIVAQRFNRDGERLGSEWLVNNEDTMEHGDSFVGMSHDGHFVVTWTRGLVVQAEVYNPQATVLMNQFAVNVGFNSTSTFNMGNDFIVGWDQVRDNDNTGGASIGVFARMYQLYDPAVTDPTPADVTGAVLRDTFRANSADFNPDSAVLWPNRQGGNQVIVDADGDLTISYDGFGADVSEDAFLVGSLYQGLINANRNADLLPYFNPAMDSLPVWYIGSNQAPDGEIEEVLIRAQNLGATDAQLGRLRAILDSVATLMRGEANGVMFSQWDADPVLGPLAILASDNVANATRDGHNARSIVALDQTVASGSFVLWINGQLVTVNVASQNNVLLPYQTAANMEAAIRAAQVTGNNWPGPPWNEGPVQVRYIDTFEYAARMGTHYDLANLWILPTDYPFEITFQGEVHDWPVTVAVWANNLSTAPVDEQQILSFNPLGPLPLQGDFTLTDGTNTTNPITFDSNDLAGTAAAIEAALQNAPMGYQGVVVTPLMGGPPFQFQIDYLGASGGANQPPLQGQPEGVATDVPPPLNAQISSQTPQDGGASPAPWPTADLHTYGDRGRIQTEASIGMEPDGDFVVAWTQYDENTSGLPSNNNVYFRRFNETTDTAGPLVTDFLLPDGKRLKAGGQVTEPLQFIVVSFDEDMMTGGIHSVTDPANWALMRDGIQLVDGISQILYGMNMASELAALYGLDVPGSNKWEAVLVLDGNGASAGITPITEGHYEIVALNSLRDKAGNALGRTGFNINGVVIDREFDVICPCGHESLVNGETDGDQTTFAHSPQAVADDAEGDYVVVWTSDAPGSRGVYAKLYDVAWLDLPAGRQSIVTEMMVINPDTGLPWPNNDVLVSSDPTADFASVSRDADGDFVVTWSSYNTMTSWDVWARRYDAAGSPLGDSFPVNSETEDVQRYSTVAMDADGDFVITWQSLGQDGSGYGVYAQRYDPAGAPIGGTDEVQVITFENHPVGTFQLRWDGDPTAPDVSAVISYQGNPFAIVDDVQAAMESLGAEVQVAAISGTEIIIRFVGADGSKDQPQVTVVNAMMTGEPGARVTVATRVEGAPGEFRVNDTTENNQRFPCIGMAADGKFVITWTGAGQDGDAPYETNIYAKLFPSNEVLRSGQFGAQGVPFSGRVPNYGGLATPWIVVADDPALHVVPPGSGFDGVVQVNVFGQFGGSGSLLTSGRHILTASHVVADFFGNPLNPADVSVTFDMPTGLVTIQASQVLVHPSYNGDPFVGGDVAIVTLEQQAPAGAERYDIYRTTDELGQVGTKYGYGMTGLGPTGSTIPPDGNKRLGQNLWEALGGTLDPLTPVSVTDDLIAYDFDNGQAANDAFDFLLGLADLGTGATNEVCGAPGDSGGPTFIGNLIAAVVTGGIDFGGAWDVSPGIDSSFGDVGFDTRVSIYANWIDAAVAVLGGQEMLVNQTIADDQKWSTVALDSDGDFVITWTSYGQDGVGSGYGAGVAGMEGVYARRYLADGSDVVDPVTGLAPGEFLVNTFAELDQQHSRVAMDADGDFVITWESFQDKPQPPFVGPNVDPDAPNSFGIFAQQYARNELLGVSPFLGPNGEMGSELAVNTTKDGDQRFPSVAMDDAGDSVIVWSGKGEIPGQTDDQGIFSQRFEKPADEAGPVVADVLNVFDTGAGIELMQVLEGAVLQTNVSQFVVTFGEEVTAEGGLYGVHSVLNTNNWELTRDGALVFGGVAEVQFGLNQTFMLGLASSPSNKYEAVLTFDGDPLDAGLQALGQGLYVLTVRETIEDIFGNPLDGDFDGVPGGNFNRSFVIFVGVAGPGGPGDPPPGDVDVPLNQNEIGNQDSPSVACAANGDHVVVWVSYGEAGDLITEGNIVGQRFDNVGNPVGAQFVLNSYVTGSQIDPDVAMDTFGNFVVTWSGEGDNDNYGVFARIFDPFGVPQADQFRVNQFKQSIQDVPRVAMDANGDFVITWTSYGQDGDKDGVYARRYNFLGQPLGDEFQVNTAWINRQENSDVAMDADGNFVAIWSSDGQDGSSWGIYGQRYNAAGVRLGGEFRLNTHTDDKQRDPQVAMDADGDFVVTWASFNQDGSGYGIYARRYGPAGGAKDASEFRVNQTALHWQITPAVGSDNDGDFVITWSTFDQDDEDFSDYGIYARMFHADGSDYVDPATGLTLGEFRVNATTQGNQVTPAIAVDEDGDFVVVWVGPDQDGTGVYGRMVGVNTATFGGGGPYDPNDPYDPYGPNPKPPPSGPASLLVTGTPGNDVFVFVGGPTPSSWFVELNGQPQYVDPHTVAVNFDGRGGDDVVLLTGTDGNETLELWSYQGVLEGEDYTVTVANVEETRVEGLGGDDQVTFHDSERNDTFVANHRYAAMIRPDGTNTATGFETAVASAATGYDVVRFYDSKGNDLFVANSEFGQLSGDGFLLQADGFDAIHTYATAGGYDVAKLFDSAGNDVFGANPIEAVLLGEGFFNRVKFFEGVHAYGTAGGYDVAKLVGSDGSDVFAGTPVYGALYGEGYLTRAKHFEEVHADGAGGSDRAVLSDSDGNDLFVASPTYAAMSGDGFSNQGTNFEVVEADASVGGFDVAKLFDSPDDDLFAATPTYAALSGPEFNNQATQFDQVHAYATAGGHDLAKLFDSVGDDTFIGREIEAALYGAGFLNRAKYFEGVHAYATADGMDEAYLYGSAGNNTFVGTSTDGALYGQGFFNRAKHFEKIHADAGEGIDRAVLYDAALDQGYTQRAIDGPGAEFARVVWLYEFEECLLGSQSSNDDPVPQAVDEVLTAYWS